VNTSTPPGKAPASRANPLADARVDTYASVGIVACRPDSSLDEVARMMAGNRVHAVVVVDDDRPEPPVITDGDLIAAGTSGHFRNLLAEDIAGREAVSVRGGDTLEHAARLLAENHITHLIVRDNRRMPVGILSTLDVVRGLGRAR
jgi:CBS domain-containing protein